MSGVKRLRSKSITSADDIVNTSPGKWPGMYPEISINPLKNSNFSIMLLVKSMSDKKLCDIKR